MHGCLVYTVVLREDELSVLKYHHLLHPLCHDRPEGEQSKAAANSTAEVAAAKQATTEDARHIVVIKAESQA